MLILAFLNTFARNEMSQVEKQVKQVQHAKKEAAPAKLTAGAKLVKVKSKVKGGPFGSL